MKKLKFVNKSKILTRITFLLLIVCLFSLVQAQSQQFTINAKGGKLIPQLSVKGKEIGRAHV